MLTDNLPMDNISPRTPVQGVAQDTLVANLRNAHALEKQVIAVLEPQLTLLDDYPDLHAKVTLHIAETREQAHRLEVALESCGSSTSMVKDALLSVMGLGQSSVQGFSSDAVLKAIVADMMTEHLEIATYRTLIVLAEMAGRSELCPALEASLREEEAMADWFNQNLEHLARRFVELEAAEDRQAGAAVQDSAGSRNGPTSQRSWTETNYAAHNRNAAGVPVSEAPSTVVNPAPTLNSSRTTDASVDGDMRQPPAFDKGPSDV